MAPNAEIAASSPVAGIPQFSCGASSNTSASELDLLSSSCNEEPQAASSGGDVLFQTVSDCGGKAPVPKCEANHPTTCGSSPPNASSIPLPGVNEKVYLRKSPVEGFGLVARGAIEKGETVWKGPSAISVTITTAAIQAMSREQQEHVFHYFYQVSETEFIGPPTEADVWRDGNVFTNHNCDPNIGWVSTFEMAATRDIQAGEELTFDYATSETWDIHPPLKCCCGSARCRGIIRWSDYLLPDVRDRLGEFYIPYVKAKLASVEKTREGRSDSEAHGARPNLELINVAAA